MGDTWMTDLRHFLDDDGELVDFGGRPLALHLCRIVAAVTERFFEGVVDTGVRCRRRPGRRPCPGTIMAGLTEDLQYVRWECPECEDNGWINGWEETQWDRLASDYGPEIRRVTYRGGMLRDLRERDALSVTSLEGRSLTPHVVAAIQDNAMVGVWGTFGDPAAGFPLQYDELVIEHGDGIDTIVVYNRTIALLTSDDPFLERFHRVVGRVQDAGRVAD